jgi:2-hydroxychromene-2-carboxylate isomerase
MPHKKTAEWFFDVVSPFSYLQLQRLKEFDQSLDIQPVPILFGAVLSHFGHLGPAEIPSKRDFAYRFVAWQASHAGLSLRFPPAHPFNPLPALRLIIAAGNSWPAIHQVFNHIWRDGKPADHVDLLQSLATEIGINDIAAALEQASVKVALKANTEKAIAKRVFGVPTLAIDNELFWGNDATDYAHFYLTNPDAFHSEEAKRLLSLPKAIERKR